MRYLLLMFFLMSATASGSDLFIVCNACSDAQMVSSARNAAYRLYTPRCTATNPCPVEPKSSPTSEVTSGDEVEVYYWSFYVHDFKSGRSRQVSVDTYNKTASIGTVPLSVQAQLAEAQNYYDFFKPNMAPAGAAAIDLGPSFPVGSAFDIVGNTPNLDKVRNAITEKITGSGIVAALRQAVPTLAIQKLVSTQLQNASLYYEVIFPDGSTALIKLTALPTIDTLQFLFTAEIVVGSLRDSDGNLIPDSMAQLGKLVQRYGRVGAGSNYERLGDLFRTFFSISLVGNGSSGNAQYSCRTSPTSDGGVTVSCSLIP